MTEFQSRNLERVAQLEQKRRHERVPKVPEPPFGTSGTDLPPCPETTGHRRDPGTWCTYPGHLQIVRADRPCPECAVLSHETRLAEALEAAS